MTSQEIENILRYHLKMMLPHHQSSEVYDYAIFPGGKLFRPHLVWSVLKDINPILYTESKVNKFSPHALLSSAVEFHHSYTLIHDDLPSMDNDFERRGKPSTHIAFGQWQALLAGDGLLNLSYQLLSKSNSSRTLELLRFFSWALGPKGLIHGQVMDLSHEMTLSLKNTLRTHELKTARLIQVAILGSAILAQSKDTKKEKLLWRYSKLLGINFQLIDDLSELTVVNLSEHEKEVNPWLHHKKECLNETINCLKIFNSISSILKLTSTDEIVSNYYLKMIELITKDQQVIQEHLREHLKEKIDILPVILLMKSFSNC